MGFITNYTAFTVVGNCNYNGVHQKSYNKNHKYIVVNKGIAITSIFSWEVYHSLIESLPELMPFYTNKSLLNKYSIITAHSKYETHPLYKILMLLNIEKNKIVRAPILVKELIIPFPSSCFEGIE